MVCYYIKNNLFGLLKIHFIKKMYWLIFSLKKWKVFMIKKNEEEKLEVFYQRLKGLFSCLRKTMSCFKRLLMSFKNF